MPSFKSDKRLYLNADRSKVVEEGDPDAAYLFAVEGDTVSAEDAKKYELRAPKAADEKDEPEPETKQVEEPPENKARSMPRGAAKD